MLLGLHVKITEACGGGNIKQFHSANKDGRKKKR